MKKQRPWFEIMLAVVYLSATVYAAFSDAYNLPNRWFIRDDAYYYFKVAQNISEGRGSTFDGLHPTNGYHPLWLLICVPIFALARFDLILPLRVLAVLTGLLQVSTAILLFRLLKRIVAAPAAVFAAAYWAFDTYILVFLYKTGVESSIGLFLLVVALLLLSRFEDSWRAASPRLRDIAALSFIALLITFARLDLIFFALMMGLWIVFRELPLRYLLPLDILAVIASAVSAFLLRLGFAAYFDSANSAVIVLGIALVVKLPIFYAMRLYHPPGTWKPLNMTARIIGASILGGLAVAVIALVGHAAGLIPAMSRAILFLDTGITTAAVFIIRAAVYGFRSQSKGRAVADQRMVRRMLGRRWFRESAIYFGILGGGMALYMLWNRIAFGTFTPVSGQIKHWWGTFTHSIYGGSATSWLTFFAVNPFSDFNAWAPPTTILSEWSNRILYRDSSGFGNPRWQHEFLWLLIASVAMLVLAFMIRKHRSVRATVRSCAVVLFVGSWLQILAYNATGYASPKEWYWLTEPLLLAIVAAMLLDLFHQLVLRRVPFGRPMIWIMVAAYSTNAAFGYWRDAYALNPYGEHSAGTAFTDVIPFLETNTAPGDVIGMTGGGNVGYLMPSRTIVNMDGLINSTRYFAALQAGTAPTYLYKTGMRYVFANPNLLDANPYRGQFSGRLQLIVDWGGKDLLRLLPEPGS